MNNPSLQNKNNGVISTNDNKTDLNIFYGRSSSLKQKNTLRNQMEMVDKYCNDNGIILDRIIIDEGKSGSKTDRDGFNELLDLIKSNKVKNLIVLSLSRFGRNLKSNYESIELMKKHNTNFISLKENLDLSNPMSVFMINVMSSLYQLELELLRDRTSDVLQSKKRNGEVYSGSVMYGYDRVGDVLVENEYEQKVLRKIYSLRNKGLSYQKVSDFLNRNNHPTKHNKKWNRNGVYFLLQTDRNSINTTTNM